VLVTFHSVVVERLIPVIIDTFESIFSANKLEMVILLVAVGQNEIYGCCCAKSQRKNI
jgi:hypothetical protein